MPRRGWAARPAGGDVRIAVAALCLVQFVDVLGVTVVVTALPAMLAGFGAPARTGGVIATGYAMFFGGLLMVGARLEDRFGHRRLTLAGLTVFAVAAVLGATASSVAVLMASRCLQGAAAAMSVPSALALLTTITTEGRQREKAIALWSAAGAAAGASGFVAGGVITELAGWRIVFWMFVPLAFALTVAITLIVAPDRTAPRSVGLNLRGAVTFTSAVMLFVLAADLLPQTGRSVVGVALLVAAGGMGVLFAVIDHRSRWPLFARSLLGVPSLRQGAFGGLLNTATTSSAITLTTLYLQNTPGRGALGAGLLLLPFSLGVIAGSATSGRMM